MKKLRTAKLVRNLLLVNLVWGTPLYAQPTPPDIAVALRDLDTNRRDALAAKFQSQLQKLEDLATNKSSQLRCVAKSNLYLLHGVKLEKLMKEYCPQASEIVTAASSSRRHRGGWRHLADGLNTNKNCTLTDEQRTVLKQEVMQHLDLGMEALKEARILNNRPEKESWLSSVDLPKDIREITNDGYYYCSPPAELVRDIVLFIFYGDGYVLPTPIHLEPRLSEVGFDLLSKPESWEGRKIEPGSLQRLLTLRAEVLAAHGKQDEAVIFRH